MLIFKFCNFKNVYHVSFFEKKQDFGLHGTLSKEKEIISGNFTPSFHEYLIRLLTNLSRCIRRHFNKSFFHLWPFPMSFCKESLFFGKKKFWWFWIIVSRSNFFFIWKQQLHGINPQNSVILLVNNGKLCSNC